MGRLNASGGADKVVSTLTACLLVVVSLVQCGQRQTNDHFEI